MARLWNFVGGEPYMVNPHLGILNPKKGSRMRKNRKGRQPAALRKYWATHRRKSRRNPWPTAGVAINSPKRRRRSSVRRSSRRKSYRRNPAIMGFQVPPMNQVIFAGVGFIAPPMVEGFLSQMLPVDLQTNMLGKYAIRIGAVLGLTWAVRQFVGSTESRMTMIGGSVYVLSTALADFAPGLIPGMGMYVPATSANQLSAYVQSTGRSFNTLGANGSNSASDLFSIASGESVGTRRSYFRR